MRKLLSILSFRLPVNWFTGILLAVLIVLLGFLAAINL